MSHNLAADPQAGEEIVMIMRTPHRKTWLFVTDGAKARLFESEGSNALWRLHGSWANAEALLPAHALGRDRPARGRSIGAGAAFAIETLDLHDKAEETFVSARAQEINTAYRQGAFEQLLVAAAPHALGVLRRQLAPDVSAALIGVFDKDLTNLPERDLHAYVLEKLKRW